MKAKEFIFESDYKTEKQLLTRIRQIQYDRKLSGTDSNAGELQRLKQQLKDLRSKEPVSENNEINTVVVYDTKGKVLDRLDINTAGQKYGINPQDIEAQLQAQDNATITGTKGTFTVGKPMVNKTTEGDRNEMDTPEFQRALASVKKQAAQGPKKTVYDPRTGKYKVVPVNPQGNKNG